MIKIFKQNILWMAVGAISRLIPHPANFTAIGGLAIYLGNQNGSIWVPMGSMFLTDLVLGFDSVEMRLLVYGAIAVMYLLGKQIKNLWLASILGSAAFFLITNVGVWITTSIYPKTGWGLVQCLYMALPFWRNAILADVIFTQIFKKIEAWLPETNSASYTSG